MEELHPHHRTDKNKQDYDLDLGNGHVMSWSYYKGEICGGIIYHSKDPQFFEKQKSEAQVPEAIDDWCSAAFSLKATHWSREYPDRTAWEFSGTYETPTISPSFLCHCGDHGWIREGKWVKA